MKLIKAIISVIIFLFYGFLNNTNAQWVQVTNGMSNLSVFSLSTSTGNMIFAGTRYDGVFLSSNNGDTWIPTSLNNIAIQSIAISGNNIYAGTFGFPVSYGVYKSTNNGTNWTQTLLNTQIVKSLAVNGNNVFAGTDFNGSNYGIYTSTNNGINWTQTLIDKIIYSLIVNGNNVFAGSSLYGVYLSTNNGTNWVQTSLTTGTIHAFAINGNNIFAGTAGSGVYLSTNNGINWAQTPLNAQIVWALAASGNNIFAGADLLGVYISNNNGTYWVQRNEGMGNLSVNALTIFNGYVFAGTTDNGVYRRPISELLGVQTISNQIPSQFSLSQNYPNPFNPSTKIRFAIPDIGQRHAFDVRLNVYNMPGEEITTLVNEQLNPGTYEADFDGSNYSSGVYYYKLAVHQGGSSTGDFTETKKMILIK